jgi:hypothetical protein
MQLAFLHVDKVLMKQVRAFQRDIIARPVCRRLRGLCGRVLVKVGHWRRLDCPRAVELHTIDAVADEMLADVGREHRYERLRMPVQKTVFAEHKMEHAGREQVTGVERDEPLIA